MKKLFSIIFIFTVLFTILSCNGKSSEKGEGGITDFGYETEYKGYTFSAIFNSYDDSKKMAQKLIEALNEANKIYRNASILFFPNIVTQDEVMPQTSYEGNGDCYEGGDNIISYELTNVITGQVFDNASFTSPIIFSKYCRKIDGVDPQRQGYETVLNGTFYLTEIYSSDVDSIKSWSKHAILDNLSIDMKLMESGKYIWDNISIKGNVIKSSEGRYKSLSYSIDNTTLALDKPRYNVVINPDAPIESFEVDYRYDLYAVEVPEKSLKIRFFYKDYGYIIVDVSFLVGSDRIPETQKIVMQYRDKECSFTIEEMQDNKFNCGDY